MHAAGLTLEQARAWTPPRRRTSTRCRGAVRAAGGGQVIEADPEAAEARRRARELEQFVSTGQSDEHGLKTLIARAEAGDVIVFVAMCDRIAEILLLEGDTAPVDVRRPEAVGVLGNPARALACCSGTRCDTHDCRREPLDEPACGRVERGGSRAVPGGSRPAASPGRAARADQRGGAALGPRRRRTPTTGSAR